MEEKITASANEANLKIEYPIARFSLGTVVSEKLIYKLCSTIGFDRLFANTPIKIVGDKKYPLLKISPSIDAIEGISSNILTYTVSHEYPMISFLSDHCDVDTLWKNTMSMITVPEKDLFLSDVGVMVTIDLAEEESADSICTRIFESLSNTDKVVIGTENSRIIADVTGKLFDYRVTIDSDNHSIKFYGILEYHIIQKILQESGCQDAKPLAALNIIGKLTEKLFKNELSYFNFYDLLYK